MTIIVDSGSTKADWCVAEDGEVLCSVTTQGISPIHQSPEAIHRIIAGQLLSVPAFVDVLSMVAGQQEVVAHFYGSGCIKDMISPLKAILEKELADYSVKFNVYNDLLGAARAACGTAPGIACILGTGANSCLYDGANIVLNTPPLGYILGDEGSGAAIGKSFLNGIFKGWLDEKMKNDYLEWSGLTYSEIITNVYRKPMANRYLASIAPFVSKQMLHNSGLEEMVVNIFRDFLRLNVEPYNRPDLPVNFVGGIANAFAVQLYKAVEYESLVFGRIVPRPVNALLKFHLER